ncbi:erythrocyte binding protein 37.2 precursor, partial [Babesia divergens]
MSRILSAVAFCLLATGLHGPSVGCNDLSVTSTASSEAVSQQPSAIQRANDQPDVKSWERSPAAIIKEVKEKRERLLSRIIARNGPLTISEIVDFLRAIDGDTLVGVDQAMVERAGAKVKVYLDFIGIKGQNVEESLDTLMLMVYLHFTDAPEESKTKILNISEELNALLKKFAAELKAKRALEDSKRGTQLDLLRKVTELRMSIIDLMEKLPARADAPFSVEDIYEFLTVPDYGVPTNSFAVKAIEKKITDYLGTLETSDSATKNELRSLIANVIEQREHIMDLIYGPFGNYEDPSESSQGSSPKKPSLASVPSSL